MMHVIKQYGYLIALLILSLSAILLESPLKLIPLEKEGFSALNAKPHIDSMASEFHFMGTPENRKVRDYILDRFQEMGIPAEVFRGYTKTQFRSSAIKMAETDNIIATIRSPNAKSSIVIAGHYDSVLNSPGAADDVHSVACMLEVARLLKDQSHLNNIVFLITDGEEMGLLGAKAFVENKDLDNIGMLLNYEARGNSGAGFFFEWSEGNSWLVHHLRKAAKRPVSNSLAYEVYKLLPNDSDFTHFKNAGIRGINHAFIDGFTYYHNPDDTPENINMNSVQHTGENMWRLTKYFANIDLEEQETVKDASFFNFMGYLIIYPKTLDLIFTTLLILMCVLTVWIYLKKGNKLSSLIKAFVSMVLSIFVVILICLLISYCLGIAYPHYDVFYVGQYYNHKWYILSSISIQLIVFYFLARHYETRNRTKELKIASILFLSVLALILIRYLPTASYMILLPSLILASYIIALEKTKNLLSLYSLRILTTVLTAGIWAPLTITLFLAFSIKLLFVPGLISFLMCLALFVLSSKMWENKSFLYLGTAVFIFSILGAHINSFPSKEHPLPSSLYYSYNVDNEESYWLTNDKRINFANEEVLQDAENIRMDAPYPKTRIGRKASDQNEYLKDLVWVDSISNNHALIKSNKEVFKSIIYISDATNLKSMKLNGHELIDSDINPENLITELYGMTQDSLLIEINKVDPGIEQKLSLTSLIRTLPDESPIDEKALRTDAYTELTQNISF